MARPPPFEAREFRAPRWAVAAASLSYLFVSLLATWYLATTAWQWQHYVIAGLVPVTLAGMVDAFLVRIVLTEETLQVVSNLRRRDYPRSAFVAVTWGKGVPVSLQFQDGTWLRLPPVGPGAQSLANTLRAWLKRPAAMPASTREPEETST